MCSPSLRTSSRSSARASSLRYLTQSLLRRRRPPGGVDETDVASAEVAQQPAAALVQRGPVICGPDVPVREVAQRMVAEGVSSVLIRADNGGLGIVTDRDLGARALAEGISADTPVREVMTTPVVTVGAEETGADVMIAMLDHDIRHVPVLSARSEVLGVIVGIDLVAAESRTPFVLRRAIAEATDEKELREAARRLRSAVIALHRAELAPAQISQVISVVADALIRRLIELAIDSEGTPPAEFCWMALGSHGRREAVPSSDVDSGMSWREAPDPDPIGSRAKRVIGAESTARYMHAIAAHVADGIRVVGWKLDPHGVTASGSFSASSIEDWHRAIQRWLTHPGDERVLTATSILLDGRTVQGPDELNPKPALLPPRESPRAAAVDAAPGAREEASYRLPSRHRRRRRAASTAGPSTSSTAASSRSSTWPATRRWWPRSRSPRRSSASARGASRERSSRTRPGCSRRRTTCLPASGSSTRSSSSRGKPSPTTTSTRAI